MKTLFSCLFGSALYGTRTPTSDRDEKYVTLPSLDNLLLGKKISNSFLKTNKALNTRNGADDVDKEYIPIQVFANDFMMGQTYALEIAFAIDGDHAEQTLYDPRGEVVIVERRHDGAKLPMAKIRDVEFQEWYYETPLFLDFVHQLRTRFLTSNIKSMMGYVVNQASLYSFKGERLNASRDFLEILDVSVEPSLGDVSLGTVYAESEGFKKAVEELQATYPKYFKVTEYDIGGGRMKPCFTLLEKTFPFTNTFDHSMKVCDSLIKKYGSRADAASESNVDWKATMHALRIVDEGLELLENHKLEFPFKPEYVAKLLSIKRGEVPLADVTAELTEKLDRLKTLEKTTSLPPLSDEMKIDFETWLTKWMRLFYEIK